MSYPQGLSLIFNGHIILSIYKKGISRIFRYILEMKIGSGFEQKGLERPRWAIDVVPFHCSVLFLCRFFLSRTIFSSALFNARRPLLFQRSLKIPSKMKIPIFH